MGVVYKAQDTKLGRLVAPRFLPSKYTRDPQAKRLFIRVARLASFMIGKTISQYQVLEKLSEGGDSTSTDSCKP